MLPQGRIRHHHVRGERDDVGADGPDVQVMHLFDPLHLAYRESHLLHVDPARHPFQQDVHRLPHHAPRPPEDDEADAHGDDRVEEVPVGEVHDDAADDDADRGSRVADHVQKRAVHV